VYIPLYNFVLCNLAVYFILLLKKNLTWPITLPPLQLQPTTTTNQYTGTGC